MMFTDPIFLLSLIPVFVVAWLFWTELKGAGWQPAPAAAIQHALKLAKVGPADVFYDLGAGDGRVLVAAAKKGAKAVGIEIDPFRTAICKLRLKINRAKNARVILGNIYNVPLADATVVFIYLRDWSTERLKRKLTELQPGTRIITYHWPLEGWRPVAQDRENELWVYEISEKN